MAKILTIDGETIRALDKTKFNLESDLQDYLEKYPSIIPIEEIYEDASDLICIGREVTVPSGAIDLMFIDKEGLLTIVETKLVKNPEIRRTVIGQLIEYASFVSQWTSDHIYKIATDYLKQTLSEKMASLDGSDFSEDDFRHCTEDNLKNGKIRLIIAVDELNEPLRATVTFLNSHSNFDFLLLQVSSFEESKTKKVLIPSLFGYAQKETKARLPKINEDIFLTRCREGRHEKAIELYLKAKALAKSRATNGDFLNWGVKGYSYRMPWKGYPGGETIFTAYSDGKLMIWPDLLVRTEETGQKYMEKLRNMAILTNEFSRNKYPTISTDKMKPPDINSFITIIEELGQKLDEISKETPHLETI